MAEDKKLLPDVKSSHEALENFMESWRQFDGAGTRLIESLQSSVEGTLYEKVGNEWSQSLKRVYSGSGMVEINSKLTEMEGLLKGLKAQLESGQKTEQVQQQIQVLCRCLMLFIKFQTDFHQCCVHTVSAMIHRLAQLSDSAGGCDIIQEMNSLDILGFLSSRNSPNLGPLPMKPLPGSTSPKSSAKHNTLKSSFLSWFDRKNSPEKAKGANFYVELPQSAVGDENSLPCMGSSDHSFNLNEQSGACNSHEDVPENPDDLVVPKGFINGHLASQEELDSVINLLSGIGSKISQPMHTIPENQMQINIPQYMSSQTTPSSDSEDVKAAHPFVHRRSEGSIDVSGLGTPGRNTWPHPHRGSLPTVPIGNQQYPQEFGGYNSFTPRRYSHDLNLSQRQTLPATGPSQVFQGYQWGMPDSKLNRTWPMQNITTLGSETMGSSWSGFQDSDELSDDSSSGEQFFAVGLDLVHVMDSRTNSSDEEKEKQQKKVTGDNRPKSMENLMDSQSTNTWPVEQSWAGASHSGDRLEGRDANEQSPSHRPVQMQWSDPLSSRNVWQPPGLSSQTYSQSMHGFGPLQ